MPRLFFALWPDEDSRTTLETAAREALPVGVGRWVPRQNLHVTLAFLGSVPDEKLSSLRHIGDLVAAEHAGRRDRRIQLELDRIEYWSKARVLCATSSRPPQRAITALVESLRERLVAGGFQPDLKPFNAHVTLARKPQPAARSAIELLPTVWTFTGFVLVESRTEERGVVYRVLHTCSFAYRRRRS